MSPVDLGSFRLEQLLGAGGMGEVWAATHRHQSVSVAIKLLGIAAAADREAFAAEVRAVARLDHPSIILVFDQGVVDDAAARASGGRLRVGTPWFAMERCRGGALRSLEIRSWSHLRVVLLDVLSALASAHAREVLHRDLTPDNVLIATSADLRPGLKLTDFGLAFAREVEGVGRDIVLGTPAYMSPEQFRREWRDYGPWTDLYAFGCVAWRLATGAPPFGSDRLAEVLAAAHQELAPPTFEPLFDVPEGLEGLLRRLLQKDPLARPRSAADVIGAIEQIAGLRESAAVVPSDWRSGVPARRPLRLFGVGLGLYPWRPVPLVGRSEERDALWQGLVSVYRGGVAGLAVLRGAQGVGKTRLAGWLGERAQETGAASVLRIEHAEAAGPGDGLPAALRRLLRCEGLDGAALETRLEEWLRGRGVRDPWEAKALTALLSSAAPADSGSVTFLTPAERHVVTRRLLERLAAERPLVLHVEDGHYASSTLDFVDHLLGAQDSSPSPVYIVVTVREETLSERPMEQAQLAELGARPGVITVDVPPLSPQDQVLLVEGLLGLGGDLATRVRARAGGNPAFAVQLVGDWVSRGLLVPTADGFVLQAGAQVVLPDDIHAFWGARIDRALAGCARGETRAALELAAMLGTEVDDDTWAAACAVAGVERSLEVVDHLVQERLVQRTATGWSFTQNMVRESLVRGAYEAGRARAGHAACAQALAVYSRGDHHAERLGRHLLDAGDPDSATDFLYLAARERLARGEDLTALGLLAERTVAMEQADVSASDLRWGEGRVLEARLRARQGDWEGATAPAASALGGARQYGWTPLLPEALTVRGEVARGRGDPALALACLGEARTLCERSGDPRELARVLLSMGTLDLQLGDLRRAAGTLRRAHALYAEARDGRAVADCLVARADAACRARDLEEVAPLLALAETIHTRHANRVGEAEVLQLRADLARARGDLPAAIQAYRQGIRLYESVGAGPALALLAGLGASLSRLGRHGDARSALQRGIRLAQRQGRPGWLGHLHAILMPVAVARGDLDALDVHLSQARRWLDETREIHPDLADAAELAAAALPDAEQVRVRSLRAFAHAQRAVLARGLGPIGEAGGAG